MAHLLWRYKQIIRWERDYSKRPKQQEREPRQRKRVVYDYIAMLLVLLSSQKMKIIKQTRK
jgi:hypothetical protein